MRLTASELADAVNLTARCLFAPSPIFADFRAVFLRRISETIGTAEKQEHWLKVTQGSSVMYIFASESGAGRYQSEPPPNVDPSDVLAIEIDPADRPVTAVLEGLGALVQAIMNADSKEIDESASAILFVGTEAERASLPSFLDYIGLVRSACEPAANRQLLQRQAARLNEALQKMFSGQGSDAIVDEFTTFANVILDLHERCGVDGEGAAWMLICRDLPPAIFRNVMGRGQPEGIARAEQVRYVTYMGGGPIQDCRARSFDVARKAAREGLGMVAGDVADELQSEGRSWVEKALGTKDLKEHQAYLFKSAPFFCAAYWIFEALATLPRTDLVPEAAFERYAASRVESNEDLVRVSHSLFNAFEDRFGAKTKWCKALLRELGASKGAVAVDDQIFQWIEQQYFYPRYFAELLRDPGDI